MARSLFLWFASLVIAVAAAYFQRVTGPTYPVSGDASLGGVTVSYELPRSHGGDGDLEIAIVAPSTSISGRVIFRRYPSEDAWEGAPLTHEGDRMTASIPHQPPAGKIEYAIELQSGAEKLVLPGSTAVVARFKGDVDAWLLISHVAAMFLAMLFALRAGLEACFRDGEPRSLALWAFGCLVVGGFAFGPFVQYQAFGDYWTGVPFGWDLTDNKTLIAGLAWLAAAAAVWNRGYKSLHPARRWFVVGAAAVLLVVFLIPHSLFGSQLDYSTMQRKDGAYRNEDFLPWRTFTDRRSRVPASAEIVCMNSLRFSEYSAPFLVRPSCCSQAPAP